VNSTGQGILDNEDYKEELKEMGLLSANVNSDGEEEWVGKICQNSQARGRYQEPKAGSPLGMC
jgi:biotin synthase-like enzyme